MAPGGGEDEGPATTSTTTSATTSAAGASSKDANEEIVVAPEPSQNPVVQASEPPPHSEGQLRGLPTQREASGEQVPKPFGATPDLQGSRHSEQLELDELDRLSWRSWSEGGRPLLRPKGKDAGLNPFLLAG